MACSSWGKEAISAWGTTHPEFYNLHEQVPLHLFFLDYFFKGCILDCGGTLAELLAIMEVEVNSLDNVDGFG